MPPARISHFISDDQLAIIEVGSRDRFFDYHLACAGAAIGFFQNVCELIWNGYFGLPLHGWDVYGAILFASFSSAAVCFRMSSNTKDDPVKKVVAEIKKRQAKPFGGKEPPKSPPASPAARDMRMFGSGSGTTRRWEGRTSGGGGGTVK